MQAQTITFFATVSNAAASRISKTGRKYAAFGVSIVPQQNQPAFHYNALARGKQGHFAKSLQKGTRIKLVVQAQSPARQHRQHPTPYRNLRATGSSRRTGVVGSIHVWQSQNCVDSKYGDDVYSP